MEGVGAAWARVLQQRGSPREIAESVCSFSGPQRCDLSDRVKGDEGRRSWGSEKYLKAPHKHIRQELNVQPYVYVVGVGISLPSPE